MEWEAAVVRWEWFPDRREVDGFGIDDALLGTRPYTAEENTAADDYDEFLEWQAEREAIEAAGVVATTDLAFLLTELALLAATSNTTINGNPATYIKATGVRQKKIAEIQLKLLTYLFHELGA